MGNKSLKAEKHPQEQIPVSFTNQQLLSHDCKYAQPQSNNDSSVRSFNSDIYDDDEPLPKSTALEKSKPNVNKEQPTLSGPQELFSISFKTKNRTLQVNSASETVEPVLFTLTTGETNEGTRVPLDIVCVLDASISMEEYDKLTLLQNTLKYIVDLLREDDRISIVRFSTKATRVTPLQRVTSSNKLAIKRAINNIKTGGSTNITAGMAQALKILNERKYRNPVSSVFLLSDGLDDEDAISGVRRLLDTQKPKDNFTINSFG